jgi:SAM-dependent methyltransferase
MKNRILAGSLMLSCFVYGTSPPINQARLLLTHLRGGDYAHAGDEEAIDLVISKVLELSPQVLEGPCLDVGSGFGGTANYLQQLQFHSIFGIDIDEAAIKYAQEHYPHIPFIQGNAHHVNELFDSDYFSFIYLFNVLYSIKNKKDLLEKITQIAKPGAVLAIFDYTVKETAIQLNDLADKPMYPIVIQETRSTLEELGWDVMEITDLSLHFLVWYQTLLQKMEGEETLLSSQFAEKDIIKVRTTFSTIERWLSSSILGGSVIYAKRQNHQGKLGK